MNTSQLSKYAPEARKAFIAAVSAQAAKLGIMSKGTASAEVRGDVLLVAGQAFPRAHAEPRKKLAERVQAHGFASTVEAIAYTWFNRFVAIRFMELHGYLDHGYRVLSHPEGQGRPEILDHAADVELPGLNRARAVELKLDGTQDEALYRLLLLAQCNALHRAMPFLFEHIGDETELLLPANLLHTDSLIRQLVESIDEDLWKEIEIIGWLYQFYISEKKKQVIGKVVKSEDIPAATQLFTPNWIVKYMVQNSLGAQWLATYPHSPLKEQMEYYIEPAEQTDEVKAQLAAITPSTLNPEELTLIDPACGSGHILVEAYELFKAIYLERGYRQRDVPQLILEKNLFGLEICPRAAQLTGFALMMKGRADDWRLFDRSVKLNVTALADSTDFDAERLAKGVELTDYGLQPSDLTELKRLFEHATTFGSLIQVPEGLAAKLSGLKRLSEATSQDLFVSDALKRLGPLVQQAEMLAARYDAVVANPPYMGSKNGMNVLLKEFAKDQYADAKGDLFACFLELGFAIAKNIGRNSMVTMESWMFLSSYEKFRNNFLQQHTLRNLAHFPYDGKRPTVMGINFGVAAMTAQKTHLAGYQSHYCCSRYYELNDDGVPAEFPTPNECLKNLVTDEFTQIPGSPLAYSLGQAVSRAFGELPKIGAFAETCSGLQTSDNGRFLRQWFEVSASDLGFGKQSRDQAAASGCKWFPHKKGGPYRKWYGNNDFVINWENDGAELWAFATELYGSPTRILKNTDKYFRPGVTWSHTTSSRFSARSMETGFIANVEAPALYSGDSELFLAILSSSLMQNLLELTNPSLHFVSSSVAGMPYSEDPIAAVREELRALCNRAVEISREDWDLSELSWDFSEAWWQKQDRVRDLAAAWEALSDRSRKAVAEMRELEERNNRTVASAYCLQEEFAPEVPIEQITLTVNPAYRYGGKLTEEEQWTRFRQDTMQELVSYAIGCMMGRYSLDAPGLIYAHSGGEGFDPSRYTAFPADGDGIVPLTDTEWFDDDAAHRLVEFISVVWSAAHLEDNLTFLANNLSPKKNESSRETLRRYLCDSFFKDHLQTYKKRPIYWLFSSGKHKAFQCLVYLHRYNEGTLSRMRSEYVIPLQGKMAARLEKLQGDIQAATSTAHQKRLEKERAKLENQQVELLAFDEQLRHCADRRITLDLDDGVKVNYGKFGDLLADVEAVTGGKADDE